jgi:polyisoprenoid-binding protein YceI
MGLHGLLQGYILYCSIACFDLYRSSSSGFEVNKYRITELKVKKTGTLTINGFPLGSNLHFSIHISVGTVSCGNDSNGTLNADIRRWMIVI